jgi:large subunit ribosomal protein L19
MQSVAQKIQEKYKKKSTIDLRSGDTVRVHQRIVEAGKERLQVFEGLVIRVSRTNSLSHSFTVRRLASGVGVEKMFLIHSPSISKVEIIKRSKVRRNYLTYMRGLTGKRARLSGIDFDAVAVNKVDEEPSPENDKPEVSEKTSEQLVEDELEAKNQSDKAKPDENKEAASEAEKIEEQPTERASTKAPAEEQNKEK